VEQSEEAFLAIYGRLGVTLDAGDFVGESFYQDALGDVVSELRGKGLLVDSDGALCAFPAGFTGRDGTPLPLIVRKSDGGFGYAATDLAALRHRVRQLGATRLLYVVGAPQRAHLQMVFAVAREAGWLPSGVAAEHVGFGSILGTDGKMLKTRAGTAVTLAELLDEAERRASTPEVGVGAVKYADLCTDRRGDYVFDWDRMLAATGNTGPYLQYAHARVNQVLRKAEADGSGEQTKVLVLDEPAEQALALLLTRFGETVDEVADTLQPHRLCAYLYDLAGALSIFYEQCPVLKSTGEVRDSRLALCSATKRVLASGLNLLGIQALERM
jgi:arginyl-tRNA synthetase